MNLVHPRALLERPPVKLGTVPELELLASTIDALTAELHQPQASWPRTDLVNLEQTLASLSGILATLTRVAAASRQVLAARIDLRDGSRRRGAVDGD